MPGEINCIFTKGLLPYVEREVGPEGVARLLELAGRSRDYLMAEYNWIPFSVASEMVWLCQEMMREPDEERWARRFGDDFMDWKPSREERAWGGAYTMSLGSPRAAYEGIRNSPIMDRWGVMENLSLGRRRGIFRLTPMPGLSLPRWICTWLRVCYERYPTNWKLPRARVTERACAARGDAHCLWDVRWKNPPLGARFWAPTVAGLAGSTALALALGAGSPVAWPLVGALVAFPALSGAAIGYGLLERTRRRQLERLRDIQADEILYSSGQLERKFRDLETKIEQLSLLIDLSAAVNATLDVEKIYEQTLQRLVHGMGYQAAYLFLVDPARRTIRGHRMAGGVATGARFEEVEFRLDDPHCGTSRVATSGRPIVVDDIETTTEPIDLPTARSLGVRSTLIVPLRVKERVFGVLSVSSGEPGRLEEADLELLTGVANHVALAVDRAESFQTIEELSRGLEDKVRVRTEQLRTAHEELQAAYRELQATQVQLVQREKMASVGQLVAGVAHELNNPIGFVYSNVTTLEDFARRLRGMLDVYRAIALPEAERARVQAEWDARKIDYALKYLDSMTQGIKEGAERARKIVRDLRVFARTQDDVWQSVDVHEDLESSLTLLNHLLKDRVTVHRKFGEVPAVECIRSQIDQVFLNLLANAAQAVQGPGAITIETRCEDGVAVLRISDTGPGIPAGVLDRIFDPFFTTKPVGEGTGLGLSISYEIVKKHGGDIRAESERGGGAAFTIRLPVARSTTS
jgi:two-component system NtrC family sensor kinase